MPNIPWYGLLHISGLLVSLIAILYALLSACQSEPGKEAIVIFLFLFFYFTFALPLIIELQFTKTAFFMAQGGFLLLVSPPNNRENGGGPPSIIYVVSLCLLFLSFLLRMESFLLQRQ